jgi:hypothetical protein
MLMLFHVWVFSNSWQKFGGHLASADSICTAKNNNLHHQSKAIICTTNKNICAVNRISWLFCKIICVSVKQKHKFAKSNPQIGLFMKKKLVQGTTKADTIFCRLYRSKKIIA